MADVSTTPKKVLDKKKKKIGKKTGAKKVVALSHEKLSVEVPQEATGSGSEQEIGEGGEEMFFWQDPDARRVLREISAKRQAKLKAAKAKDDDDDGEGIIIRQGSGSMKMTSKKGGEWLEDELFNKRIRTRCPYTLYDRAVVKSRLGQHIATEPKNKRKAQAEAKKNAKKQRKKDKFTQSRGDLWHLKF